MPTHTAIAARILAECRLIATFTEQPGRTTRRFLTPPVADLHTHLRQRMTALGMTVTTDAIGNLHGLWTPNTSASHPPPPRLILGSHIDTVPNAGAFDGVLGVVLALEWLQIVQQSAYPRPIEIIAFSEEEGVRYAIPFLGSRAAAGTFDPQILANEDADGIPMHQAIRNFGLNPEAIPEAKLAPDAYGYLEIHIEQGPVLESENLPLAVVTGIAGQSRLSFRFTGQSNHAGTTPMHLRRDALAAAAEWMHAVESLARQTEGLVATIGKISLEPNATNVIPGTADLSLDVRHISNRERLAAVDQCTRLAEEIAHRRNLTVEFVTKMNEQSVEMDPILTTSLATALESAGYPAKQMPSGAGHDAMVIAQLIPSAMLFLRTPGGISHHPEETVLPEDLEAALKVAEHFFCQPVA